MFEAVDTNLISRMVSSYYERKLLNVAQPVVIGTPATKTAVQFLASLLASNYKTYQKFN